MFVSQEACNETVDAVWQLKEVNLIICWLGLKYTTVEREFQELNLRDVQEQHY